MPRCAKKKKGVATWRVIFIFFSGVRFSLRVKAPSLIQATTEAKRRLETESPVYGQPIGREVTYIGLT